MRPVRLALGLALLGLAACGGGGGEEGIRDALVAADPDWYDAGSDSWRRIEIQAPAEREPIRFRGGAGLGDLLTVIVIVAAAAVAILIVVGFVRWYLGHRAEPESVAPTTLAQAPPDLTALPVEADDRGLDDPERMLATALDSGDRRQAAIWLYVCLLLGLHRRGLLRLERGRTNGGYRRDLAGAPAPTVELFTGVAHCFEAAYFGDLPVADTRLAALVGAWRRWSGEGRERGRRR